jgi:integrase
MKHQSQTPMPQQPEWQWPVDLSRYNRTPTLSEEEHQAIDLFCTFLGGDRWFLHPVELDHLQRLLTPINDVLAIDSACRKSMANVRRQMLRGMSRHQIAYWGWSEEQWGEVIKAASHVRHQLVAVGYVLGDMRELHHTEKCFFQARLAARIFGHELVNQAVTAVRGALKRLGYGRLAIRDSQEVVCEALLANRNPLLRNLTAEVLEQLRHSNTAQSVKGHVVMLSRALVSLGILAQPFESGSSFTATIVARGEIGVSVEWLAWCQRWKETVVARPSTRKGGYHALLKVGRWLNSIHPEIVSPEQWTRELCVEYVGALSRMKIGEHIGNGGFLATRQLVGKPLKAATVDGNIGKLRKFFRDCQEWGWIERRFDPSRALQTPRSIRGSLGPNPHVIADDVWAKLLWAGLNLEAADLPQVLNKGYYYPLEMVRAVVIVWLFAGLRSDEIRRLRVGCIRWQQESGAPNETDSESNKRAICLLDVPVNKTGTAFTKAVDRLVGEAVIAWEKNRSDQPSRFEEKTGEVVNYLFAHRGRSIGDTYLNKSLIPSLCRKAGVPLSDVRGRITSHRARSTIATQLYNAKEPLSLFELQEWLGHRSPVSTQYYAKISATKLAKSYADAGYFERNIRTIEVLIDRDAILNGAAANGTPWQYFDLGHGYCTNSFFVTCPHRMACAKCDFYLPKGSSQTQMLEAKGNLQQMLQKIPLTEDERRAVEEGVEFMGKLCNKLADVPTPAGPTPREIEACDRHLITTNESP